MKKWWLIFHIGLVIFLLTGYLLIMKEKKEYFLFAVITVVIITVLTVALKLKKIKKQFVQSETLMRGLFDNMPSGAAVYQVINDGSLGRDYIIKEFNQVSLEIEGKTREEVVGKSLYDLRPEIDTYGLIPVFQKVWRTGISEVYPAKVYKDNKYENWYENYIFRLSGGEIVAIYNDVTESKRAEEALRESELKFRSYVYHAPDGIFVADENGFYVDVNPAAEKTTGYSRDELINMNLIDLIAPEDRDKVREGFKRLKKERKVMAELSYVRKNGSRRQWIVEAVQVLDNYYLGFTKDITKRKVMLDRLFDERERLRITLLSVGDAVISTDQTGRIEIMNEVAQRLTGWSESQAKGRPFEEVFNIVNEFSREKCDDPVKKVLETGTAYGLTNHTILIAKDGTERAIADSAAPIIDKSGAVRGVVLVFRDVTMEKEKMDRIAYLSYHDQLTGLYNRRFFEEDLKRLDVERNLPISLVMTDVNGLKLVNDAFGHRMGDELLRKTAEIIKNECRSDDIIARLGGDEYIILLPKTNDTDTQEIVKRIKKASESIQIESITLSFSFGWDTKYNMDEDIEEVLKKAESLMYKQKLSEGPSMRGKTIQVIINTLMEKSKKEEQHSKRVSIIAESLASSMGMNERDINEIKTVALLHDIGKIAIGESILNKAGKLTVDERKEIERHPEIGYRILCSVNEMAELAEFVLAHHEHWDGAGSKGIKGGGDTCTVQDHCRG